MLGSIFKLEDIGSWLVVDGLVIVMIAIGASLISRLVHWISLKAETRMRARAVTQIREDLVSSEPTKYLHAAIQAADWAARSIVYFVATILILIRFGVPLTSLVAPATVVGVALGFGAQRVVQDILGGFFIVTERQYGVGDVIRISQPGALTGVSGTVEEVTLRITRLRTLSGELVVIPNGQILQVANLSRDWSQVVIDFQIPLEKGPEKARVILAEECRKFGEDEKFLPLLLSPPEVTGVEAISLGYVQIRVIAKTLPSRQWEVARELRFRLVDALSAADLLPDSSSASVIQQAI